jgi:hypothetical protein
MVNFLSPELAGLTTPPNWAGKKPRLDPGLVSCYAGVGSGSSFTSLWAARAALRS